MTDSALTDVPRLRLFSASGVELEYMIVDAESLDVRPISDRLLAAAAGAPAGEHPGDVELGDISWSNELALHVVELKTTDPATDIEILPRQFQENVERANALLATEGARLMPTAMHPWMDPHREMQLWPHDNSPVYEAFHRVFDCRGHGWANLQSVHLNLPFADDAEFGRLHAAVRLVLPLSPALAASSPVMDGHLTGILDNRLEVYRTNAARIPSVSGDVIPEPVFSQTEYGRVIFQRMYRDIAPHDPDGVLQHEWLNARGAIARFDRGAIEIRLLDVQECPLADLAIVAAVRGLLEALVEERWTSVAEQQEILTAPLAAMLRATSRDADEAVIDDVSYLRHFGITDVPRLTAQELWRHIVESLALPPDSPWRSPLECILQRGPLARRILRSLGRNASPDVLRGVYGQICDSLAAGVLFDEG
ncbi:MAG: glutamate--cysteine ligase [Planctomycetes bacterium]|nr:glutamate--cysteine ligase [Planctomycetota bacterium]